MKKEILDKYYGKYCSIDEIVSFVEGLNEGVSRKTVIWNVNDLIRQGKAVRVGRGVYGFIPMKQFSPVLSETTRRVCSMLHGKFRYLVVTVTDSAVLGQFMNLQPFSTIVVLETKKTATGAILSALRKEGVDACAKRDYKKLEHYFSAPQLFLVRPELSVNPILAQQDNIRIASLEKILVDLVCDDDIYGQYQGEELRNIFQSTTNDYAVNYSKVLKYAAARKKKASVQEMLLETKVYSKIRSFI